MATVTRKGQITLPRAVREALGLEAGSEVDFEIASDGVRLRRRVSRANLEKWVGCGTHEDGGRYQCSAVHCAQ